MADINHTIKAENELPLLVRDQKPEQILDTENQNGCYLDTPEDHARFDAQVGQGLQRKSDQRDDDQRLDADVEGLSRFRIVLFDYAFKINSELSFRIRRIRPLTVKR